MSILLSPQIARDSASVVTLCMFGGARKIDLDTHYGMSWCTRQVTALLMGLTSGVEYNRKML